MKRLFIVLLTSLLFVPFMWGQNGDMTVKEFYLVPTDLTANTPGTMEYDQNGALAALVKVQTVEEGFSFDNGYKEQPLVSIKTFTDHADTTFSVLNYISPYKK